MSASGGTMRATRTAGAPRWRAVALAATLTGTLWGAGFSAGRLTAPDEVMVRRDPSGSEPELIRPGRDRGQVRFGSGEEFAGFIRPGDHAGGTVKGG